jgi:hypothetical protein
MQPHIYSLTPKAASLEELIRKAKSFVAATKASATLKAFRNEWRDFESLCRAHNLPSLPSTPESVALYIADRASRLASGTIARRLTSITKAHQAAGFTDSPATTRHFVVGETLGVSAAPSAPRSAERLRFSRQTSGGSSLPGARSCWAFGTQLWCWSASRADFGARSWRVSIYVTSSSPRTASSSPSANRRRTRRAPDEKWARPLEPVRIPARSGRCANGSTSRRPGLPGRSKIRPCIAAWPAQGFDRQAPQAYGRQGGIEGRGAWWPLLPRRLRHPGRHERRPRVHHHAPDGSQDHCAVAALHSVGRNLSRERCGRPRDLKSRPGNMKLQDLGSIKRRSPRSPVLPC